MTISLAFFISLLFSLLVHILYIDVVISILSFFILFPILNIIIPEEARWLCITIRLKSRNELKNDKKLMRLINK